MKAQYRAILPGSARLNPRVEEKEEQPRKKRQGNSRFACDRCREKKASCDGERPACARCSELNITCEYTETPVVVLQRQLECLQDDLQQHADFVNHLRYAPETKALEIIRRLKSTDDVSSVLSFIEGAVHTAARPSDLETARAILPRTEFGIEFELNMQHRSVYPMLAPLDFSIIDTKHMFGTSGQGHADEDPTIDMVPTIGPPPPLRGTHSRHTSPISGPVQDRHYFDPRLNRLRIKYWTTIPMGDEFAASVLSHHFETYHAIFGCIDCDLFLSDLVTNKLDHCSPFLLSAIMSFACQSYSTFDVRSSAFTVAFMREAEKLWRAEQMQDDPKTLAALCYLSMACNLYGNEQLRHESAAETRAMATRMSLIGTRPTDDLADGFRQLPADKIKELAHVAWGVYGMLSFQSMYYVGPAITFAPMLPVPGDVGALIGPSRFVWPADSIPACMGRVFPKISSLWMILQEINSIYFSTDERSLGERVPLAFAESKCQKLLAWAGNLSSDLVRAPHSTCHVFFFHGVYHCIMLYLFRPFLDSPETLRLGSFTSLDATPSTVYYASLKQLKRLMVTYCTASPPLPALVWFNCVALEVGNALIQNLADEPHWSFYFQVCFEFWKRAYVRYRIYYPVLRAFLLVALKSGAIGYDIANSMLEELRETGKHYDAPEVAISSAIVLALDHQATLETLATQFDELALLHEFINLDQD